MNAFTKKNGEVFSLVVRTTQRLLPTKLIYYASTDQATYPVMSSKDMYAKL